MNINIYTLDLCRVFIYFFYLNISLGDKNDEDDEEVLNVKKKSRKVTEEKGQ